MSTEDLRWHAVATRTPVATTRAPAARTSAGADAFVYAVVTTGVFCRPGCASRAPRRSNVRFFDTAAQARSAGFRACKRCRPDQLESTSPAADATLQRVVAACQAMLECRGPLGSAELEQLVGCSSRQLSRDFTALLGVSPGAFGRAVRSGQARTLLRERDQVIDAIFDSGFGSVRGFYETTAPTLGMTPAQYSAGGTGQVLRWTQVDTAVGTILAVAGDLGLTAVHIGSDLRAMLALVRAELPRAVLDRADDELAETAAGLRALAEGRPAGLELPTEVAGTAFRAKVWAALRRIPAGQTRSYRQVAEDLGAPSAARAVARACATNRTALVVPCHRVLRADGGLGGYRWGLEVKRRLLAAEAARVTG